MSKQHSKVAQAIIDKAKGTSRIVTDWWTGSDDEVPSPRVQRILDLEAGKRVAPLVRVRPAQLGRQYGYTPYVRTTRIEKHGTGVGNQDNITDRVRKALAEGADYLETKS